MRKPTVFIFPILTLLLIVLSLCACSGDADVFSEHNASPTPDPVKTTVHLPRPASTMMPKKTPQPTESLEGKSPSLLTGEYVDDDIARARPIAVVINNLEKALPQSGLGQAGLYYEVLAEGDITRIIAVFQGADTEKIGPIRSARHYFMRFALDNDAIFAHHGGSEQSYEQLRSLRTENIDGMKYDGTYFWRDPERVKQSGMYEHSSYSNAAKLLEAAEKLGYDTIANDEAKPLFSYYEKITVPDGGSEANIVRVPFASYQKAYFEYDKKTGLYKRFEYGEPQIDEETGKQLTVTNVVIQSAKITEISGDAYGRRDVKLVDSGTGYLATAGVYIPIKWSKLDENSPTRWFTQDGEELFLNRGKTWICVLQSEKTPTFE